MGLNKKIPSNFVFPYIQIIEKNPSCFVRREGQKQKLPSVDGTDGSDGMMD